MEEKRKRYIGLDVHKHYLIIAALKEDRCLVEDLLPDWHHIQLRHFCGLAHGNNRRHEQAGNRDGQDVAKRHQQQFWT